MLSKRIDKICEVRIRRNLTWMKVGAITDTGHKQSALATISGGRNKYSAHTLSLSSIIRIARFQIVFSNNSMAVLKQAYSNNSQMTTLNCVANN